MNPGSIIVIVVVIAAVVGLSFMFRNGPDARQPPTRARRQPSTRAPRPASFQGAQDVIYRSIGIHVVRRLAGRPTHRPADRNAPTTVLSADEVAGRIGRTEPPLEPPPDVSLRPAGGGSAATAAAARAAAARAAAAGTATARAARAGTIGTTRPIAAVSAADRSAQDPPAPAVRRERLVHDAGVVLLVLTILSLVAVVVGSISTRS